MAFQKLMVQLDPTWEVKGNLNSMIRDDAGFVLTLCRVLLVLILGMTGVIMWLISILTKSP